MGLVGLGWVGLDMLLGWRFGMVEELDRLVIWLGWNADFVSWS